MYLDEGDGFTDLIHKLIIFTFVEDIALEAFFIYLLYTSACFIQVKRGKDGYIYIYNEHL